MQYSSDVTQSKRAQDSANKATLEISPAGNFYKAKYENLTFFGRTAREVHERMVFWFLNHPSGPI